MIRFLLGALATLSLALAVVLAVIDATRSIAASAWTFTSLADSVQMIASRDMVGGAGPVAGFDLWGKTVAPLLDLPAFAVFAALALLLYVASHAGRRRRRSVLANV